MISRKTAKAIGEFYEKVFTRYSYGTYGSTNVNVTVLRDELYDFLYENNYDSWFCNMVNKLYNKRSVQELIMKLHTGETLYNATPDWKWNDRKKLGIRRLRI